VHKEVLAGLVTAVDFQNMFGEALVIVILANGREIGVAGRQVGSVQGRRVGR
jgi:hypothetical protein